MTFSIVLPTKNSESKIKGCLDSIFKQKIKDKIELIVIDANSKDKTIKILNKYKNKKKNIKIRLIINNKNAEAATAEGIHRAKNEFIVFLGSDDRLYNNLTLLEVKHLFAIKQSDIIFGSYQLIDQNERRIKNVKSQKLDYKKILNKKNYICATSLYFKRNIFKKINKNIDDGYDYAFILKTFNKFKVYRTSKILSKFMLHEMSNSGNFYKNIINLKKDWEISSRYGGHVFNTFHLRYLIIKIMKFLGLLKIAEMKRKKTWNRLLKKKISFKKNSDEVTERIMQS